MMEGQVKKREREREVNAGTGEEKGGSLGGRFKGASRNSEFTRRLFSLLSLPPLLPSFLSPLRSRGKVFPAPILPALAVRGNPPFPFPLTGRIISPRPCIIHSLIFALQ